MVDEISIKLNGLLHRYTNNYKNDPLKAKEALEKYKKLCQNNNIPFNYYEFIKINTKLNDAGISKEQLNLEIKLSNNIKDMLKTPNDKVDFTKLKYLIKQYCHIYCDRYFYAKYYLACYEQKRGNLKQALDLFENILLDEPENIIVLNKVCYLNYTLNQFDNCEKNTTKCIKYSNPDYRMYLLLAKCYIKNDKLDLLLSFSNSVLENMVIDRNSYFKEINLIIEKVIEVEKNHFERSINPSNNPNRIKKLIATRNKLDEMKAQALSDSPEVIDSILQEYDIEKYEQIICNCLFSETDEIIHLNNIKPYIENLNISFDKKMLLYLVSSKFLFQNKFEKEAEIQLKIVEKEKKKSPYIKKQYEIFKNNKMLYKNK